MADGPTDANGKEAEGSGVNGASFTGPTDNALLGAQAATTSAVKSLGGILSQIDGSVRAEMDKIDKLVNAVSQMSTALREDQRKEKQQDMKGRADDKKITKALGHLTSALKSKNDKKD